jgi:hypothetical protein
VLPRAVSDHYRAQQRLVVATVGLASREWARMGEDFDAAWRRVGPRLALLTSSAQLGAARSGAQYIGASLEQIGQSVDPVAEVNPDAFAGWASDGRPLDGLLYGAVTTTKRQVALGADPSAALAVGGRWLSMAVHTQISDAARSSAGVAITARPRVGWVRMVNPPCCKDCAILAGKFFRWNQGFDRHPHCDCTHIPTTEDVPGDLGTDPNALFSSGQVTGLSDAERQAIADRADPSQVVNASRKMSADGLYTKEGTTRRGYASYVQRALARQRGQIASETATKVGRRGAVTNYTVRRVGPRPTPEAIYRYATSHEDALALLRANGYVRGALT